MPLKCALAEYLHTLAGVSGNVGATDAYELSSKLSVQLKSAKEAGEQKIRVDLISQMQLLTIKMDELVKSIREQIKPEITQRKAAPVASERNWNEWVVQLKTAISENDSIALDMIEEVLANSGEGAVVNCLRKVQLSLSDFNFDKALDEINRGIDDGLFR